MSDSNPAKKTEGPPTPGRPHPVAPGAAPKQRVTAGVGTTTERAVKPVVKVDGVTPVSRPKGDGAPATSAGSPAESTSVMPVINDNTPDPRVGAPPRPAAARTRRQAKLKLTRVDPWSVSKVVFALTVALMIVAVVAVTILWIVLSFAGVWDQINSSVSTVLSDNSSSFDITKYLGLGRMVGLTIVISAINVVISTAVATIGAYLYNLSAQLLGGFDLTLAEDD